MIKLVKIEIAKKLEAFESCENTKIASVVFLEINIGNMPVVAGFFTE